MSSFDSGDLSDFSLTDLFRMEVEARTAAMTESLLVLEQDGDPGPALEELMRGAHSLKGAAGMVDHKAVSAIAHHMEDCFVAVQNGRITLGRDHMDLLLGGIDLISRAAQGPEDDPTFLQSEVEAFLQALAASIAEKPVAAHAPPAAAGASVSGLDPGADPDSISTAAPSVETVTAGSASSTAPATATAAGPGAEIQSPPSPEPEKETSAAPA
ncbi:MAG: hybrid sensor histidine kinase/response regulator, partial [Verrucomicrobiaceae bacterium]